MLANSPPTKGSVALRSGWSEMLKTPGLDLHWAPQRIDVTSPTRAVEYGTYTESFDTPTGKGRDAGTYVTVWHKVNGRWKIALDAPVSSEAPPPAMPAEATEFVARNASSIAWADFAPPGFPPGAKISVLSGDPSKAGQFAVRLSFPADYLVPLHWHPTGETVTILSGSVHFGMGNSLDMAKTEAYGVGDYVFIPARHAHFLHAPTPTVVQVTGNGPFQINLGAPK
jgi:quercetin dioxygenase-like cupin family protein